MHDNVNIMTIDDALDCFEAFKVWDKVEKLINLSDHKKANIIFSRHVVIAIPVLDKDGKHIKETSPDLFVKRYGEAYAVAHFLSQHANVREMTILANADQVTRIFRPVDQLILFHEFVDEEKHHLLKALEKNFALSEVGNPSRILELY